MKSRGGLGTPLLLPRFYFFALLFTSHRSPLSERLEQATHSLFYTLSISVVFKLVSHNFSGFKPRPSRCFLREGTLLHFVCLHPGVSLRASSPFGRSRAARFACPNRRACSQATQECKWIPAIYCWEAGVAILLGMFHAKDIGISSGHVGLWLVCSFTFYLPIP